MGKLEGKIALVTGGAQGIGQAVAVRLAEDGADVVVLDPKPAADTAAAIGAFGRRSLTISADASDPDAVIAAASEVTERIGEVDILVNNAGLHPSPTRFEDITWDFWQRYLSVNLNTMFLTTQAFLPPMRAKGWGRVINFSSSAVNVAVPMGAAYVTSKAGVMGLTRAVATEAGPDNVTVNAIAPSLARTPGAETIAADEEMFAMVADQQSIKKGLVAGDLAGAVSFLASEDAAFITGQHLHVDGGLVRAD